ncbi:MAG: Rne/Rng family ribonuclease [Acidobacteriota bacterium]
MITPKKMLVESGPHETRVAILEHERLTELFIERHHQKGIVGNIYKGRVSRVLPGMQAAFVDIGVERDAFLYVSEVLDSREPYDELSMDDEGDDDVDDEVQEELPPVEKSIDQLLRQGQEVVVQVLKDAMPNKGARVSTQITLPGRSLVLLPGVPHLGVSRRIEDEEHREQIRARLEAVQPPGYGLIARTAGATASEEELRTDLDYLLRLQERLDARAQTVSAPTLLHRDLDVALRVIRDELNDEFATVWVEGEEAHRRVLEFVEQIKPSMASRVRLDEEGPGLFGRFDLEREIEAALDTKVWLKSGGHIVIHPTEALVAIDVNTGRYVGRHNLEDTVLTTNLEAVQEIVRQIRLRNLGGIIVIDLIDMVEESHRDEVFVALEAELAKDRSKNKVLEISEFGLVQLTRKRSRPSLERLLTSQCPYCRGAGRIRSLTTTALELRRRLLAARSRFSEVEILLRAHPDLAQALQREDRPILDELESELRSTILIQSDSDMHRERFDFSEL